MDLRLAKMIEIAEKPYKRIGKKGDTVLIIGDTLTEAEIFESFSCAAKNLGLRSLILIMETLERDYADPPMIVQEAAKLADILHYVPTMGIIHSNFGRSMSKLKKRKIVSDGVTAEMLLRGSALADMDAVRTLSNEINEVWNKGSEVEITSECGTDLKMNIKGRKAYWAGFYPVLGGGFELGSVPSVQFPGGEAGVAPLEDTAEGVIFIDKSIHFPPGLLTEPIRLEIKKGTIVDIDGGHEAQQFEKWLRGYGDKNGFRICELSIGTNEKAFWMGSPRQDRFVLGSCHVGFGMNLDVGGTIDSNIHYDGIIGCPTIKVDKNLLVNKGKINLV